MKAVYDINNKASLQRGAKYYVNYCMGCHSLKYLRYSNVAKDLDIDPEIFEKNLIFSSAKLILKIKRKNVNEIIFLKFIIM